MKGLSILLLLCCLEMCAVLTRAQSESHFVSGEGPDIETHENNSTADSNVPVSSPESSTNPTSAFSSTSQASSSNSADSSATISLVHVSHRTPFLPVSQRTPFLPDPESVPKKATECMFDKRDGLTLLMVVGGLIIACTFLVVITVVLTWKVCHLSGRILVLTSDADLISNSEYLMSTAKRNKSKSDTDAKESAILLSDITQTQEEMGESETKEEGGNASKDGQTGEETVENGKKVESDAKSETSAGGNVSNKPEATTDSLSTTTKAALSPKGSEKPKEAV